MNKKQRKRKAKTANAKAQAHSQPSRAEVPESPHTQGDTDAEPRHENSKKNEIAMKKERMSNWFLVAFTAALVITGLLQWDAIKEQLKAMIDADRPWVGQTEGVPSDVTFSQLPNDAVGAEYLWRVKNSGRRPARVVAIETTRTWLSQCTMTPDFSEPKDAVLPEGIGASSREIVLPDTEIVSRSRNDIPAGIWNQITRGTLQYCIYISIKYRDVDYPQMIHNTRDCQVLVPAIKAYAGCAIDYVYAD